MGLIRQTARRVLPRRMRDVMWYWRSSELRVATAAARMLIERHGCVVLTGPFRGMRYVETSFGSTYPPKLLGTYENELHPLLRILQGKDYQRIIDIGAAEGYYTVGLAMIFPAAFIIGYEMQGDAHRVLRQLAENNGVAERITIKGTCVPELLQQDMAAPGRTLMVCDSEGAEEILLRPEMIPALCFADLLVETHDHLVAGVAAALRERFAATHDIETIMVKDRTATDWPAEASFVPETHRHAAMAEHRGPGQMWLWMKAKSAGA